MFSLHVSCAAHLTVQSEHIPIAIKETPLTKQNTLDVSMFPLPKDNFILRFKGQSNKLSS